MLPQVKEDILNVIDLSIKSLKQEKHQELSEISNHIIHDASIFQDDDSLSVAVLTYALSKIVQRCCEKGIAYSDVVLMLQRASSSLRRDDLREYNSAMQDIFKFISKIDSRLKLYIQEVIDKARIKKASKLNEHGLSIGRTAAMLGITQWELVGYISKSKIEPMKEVVTVKERLKTAREIFE